MVFSNFDLSKILNIERFFQASPGSNFEYYKEFLVFFGLLLFVGVVARIVLIFQKSRVSRKLLGKIKRLSFSISIVGFLYLFFRAEGVYFFSARFFLAVILLIFVVWSFFLGLFIIRKYQGEKREYQRERIIKKYLPKKKKKK